MKHIQPVHLLVAEPLGLVREGLVGLLAGWPHGDIHAAATLDVALTLLQRHGSAILLLDEALLGTDPGAGLRAIRPAVAASRMIILAARESRDGILACLAAGAHGYIAKTSSFAELVQAIEMVRGGGVHVPASLVPTGLVPTSLVPTGLAAPAAPPTMLATPMALTGRQQDVLRLLAEGRSTKDIARTLDLAVSTIKVHLAAVYRTFGARNRVEALCRAGCLPHLGQAA